MDTKRKRFGLLAAIDQSDRLYASARRWAAKHTREEVEHAFAFLFVRRERVGRNERAQQKLELMRQYFQAEVFKDIVLNKSRQAREAVRARNTKGMFAKKQAAKVAALSLFMRLNKSKLTNHQIAMRCLTLKEVEQADISPDTIANKWCSEWRKKRE